jgi:hypothetical protein
VATQESCSPHPPTHLNLSTKSSTTAPSLASAAAVPTSRAALRRALRGPASASRRLKQQYKRGTGRAAGQECRPACYTLVLQSTVCSSL